ncbi:MULTISPECIES: tautomerase family protein [Vibrio]|uniref:Tautomerase family protein n=1 Tax=Vibrio kanaloae TaxID=170673 RepID=A0A4U1XDS8_9VIBR|nr:MULTISPECIES: tautomerase family protein [Vibrio]KAB0465902.1 tautomerase family protein [Vibrio kanaloae]MCG9556414.1 tautomerase family protein [Vibrio kanaloae]QPK06833.1 tautomerase family protein [Vibrio kanaloae]TKE99465.1 tautomerase family protein [Vibrio kanaloae]TKF05097.1 tautomerase family protein [Vibrio kanaloae]
MIVIYGIKECLNPIKLQLSNVLQQCLNSEMGLPDDKRAHRFVPLERDDFFYPEGRSEAYTVIEINMMEGRAVNTKKRLIKKIFSEIEKQLGISPLDIEITIKEQPSHCWGFRGMTGDEAQDLQYKVKV